ncbi:MAG: TRAP transporter large permease subunit [Desulfobacula sp.]|uniref:TRAP transporter large permease n=1 Tax=Desulfobacula sp. TaxID=2593537 RepID=UPI002A1509FC|nr:TRAP transporter large permease subunit [Desulfobacula sp.]MBT7791210.1 TRAP transporter large permease subunit [Desulfobacula sp.]
MELEISIGLITLLLFGGLIILVMLGVPVVYSLGGLTLGLTFLFGTIDDLFIVASTTVRVFTNDMMTMIPLFLLMGNILVHSGVSDRLYTALGYWLYGIKGSLAVITIGVCVALAMTSGFGPGILTMGMVAVPSMLKQNYNKSLALGSVMAGGVLGEIIPPSIIMILFAMIGKISVGQLFIGGAVPGFVCAFLYIVYIVIRAHLQPDFAPSAKRKMNLPLKLKLKSLAEVIAPSLLVILVLGTIFMGIATPSEAAALGVVGSIIICAAYGKLTFKIMKDSCFETIKITSMALWIFLPAILFGIFYTMVGVQDAILDLLGHWELNRWLVLILMQVILFVFGMFMDDYAIVFICAPIFLPVAEALGFDKIWFSILFILNMQVAYLTPPFGWASILLKSVVPEEIKMIDIWKATPPFIIIQLLVLILAMIFPQLVMWLPSKMM